MKIIKTNHEQIEKQIQEEIQSEDCMIPMRDRLKKLRGVNKCLS